MLDPETAKIAIGAIAGHSLLLKLLGPTAEYYGNELKNWTERRRDNVGRIVEVAARRLGDDIEEDAGIHPKLLKELLEDGSYCEDEVVIEYFGGVLASSRTGVLRDDRGAALARLVERLTTYQVRAHYMFYRLIKELHDGSPKLVSEGETNELTIFIPEESFFEAMDLRTMRMAISFCLTFYLVWIENL
jgi:hypothetical protein